MFRRMIAMLFAAVAMLGVGSRVSGVGKTTAPHSDTRPPTIDSRAIAAHIRFLASDALEGRETGMRGFEIAAEYVRAQFEAIGLHPLHDDLFQGFALRAATHGEKESWQAINGAPLAIRKDFLLLPIFAPRCVHV